VVKKSRVQLKTYWAIKISSIVNTRTSHTTKRTKTKQPCVEWDNFFAKGKWISWEHNKSKTFVACIICETNRRQLVVI